jgi:aminopeptidase N
VPLRRPASVVAALVGGLVTTLTCSLAGLGPATAAPVPEAGSSGVGDGYFPEDGNGGYDVTHYDIHDTYRLHTGSLRGWTEVSATANQTLTSFHLDLVLTPDADSVDGAPASYAKTDRHELEVTPAVPVVDGADFTVKVSYHGTPHRIRFGGERPFFAVPGEAVATNEPHIAPWWFAANDHPSDKAAFDIAVRVRGHRQVVSNGTLVDHSYADDWSTWRWRVTEPMATYLAFFTAGRFRIERGVSQGRPWLNAVSRWYPRRYQDVALRLLRRTPGYVRWLESQFGPYPFESTGGVISSLYTGFALENQTRPTYPFMGDGPDARITVVHELAHQWFGDKVSVSRWRNIWLNEGFATWAEWRWQETHGQGSAQRRMLAEYSGIPADRAFWKLVVARPGPKRLFNAPVYDRGAMTLQALRHRIGTATFLQLLRTWTDQHAYANGSIDQFEALAADVSGQDLTAFFDAWLHTGARPARTAPNGLR